MRNLTLKFGRRYGHCNWKELKGQLYKKEFNVKIFRKNLLKKDIILGKCIKEHIKIAS